MVKERKRTLSSNSDYVNFSVHTKFKRNSDALPKIQMDIYRARAYTHGRFTGLYNGVSIFIQVESLQFELHDMIGQV